jgi:hypothetical protein
MSVSPQVQIDEKHHVRLDRTFPPKKKEKLHRFGKRKNHISLHLQSTLRIPHHSTQFLPFIKRNMFQPAVGSERKEAGDRVGLES